MASVQKGDHPDRGYIHWRDVCRTAPPVEPVVVRLAAHRLTTATFPSDYSPGHSTDLGQFSKAAKDGSVLAPGSP